MEQTKKKNDYYTIDLKHIFKALWRRIWIVILAAIIAGAAGFVYSSYVVQPKYSSTIKIYVNNSTNNSAGAMSSSQILAAQQLVNTYREILHSRTTYEQIITKTGLTYTTSQLASFITSGASNDTDVMFVTVTTNDPDEAAKIANGISDVLMDRITEMIKNSEPYLLDPAIPNYTPVSPNIVSTTVLGMIVGIMLSVLVIAIFAMLDNTIHDEDYIIQNFDYPILAKIPDAGESGGLKRYGQVYKSGTTTDSSDK